jgi:methylation protein EvaC
MPIANGFLNKDEFSREYFFELKVGFCPTCAMVQLIEQPSREMMFHENYAFFSSTSVRMDRHFGEYARDLIKRCSLGPKSFAVEIGSNDGIMLKYFKDAGIPHLGIEPSANVATAAQKVGIETVCEFFDDKLGAAIAMKYGQADVIMAANVICHIPYLHSIFQGVGNLLKPRGLFVFEDPYVGDIVEKTSYDQIYDEHVFYFSVTSVDNAIREHGLEVVDVERQNVHGGSMRYYIAKKREWKISKNVSSQKELEMSRGLSRMATYERFRGNVESSKERLIAELRRLKDEGKRVVGYGATSKSTTVTNYCGITPDMIEFISDTTPTKTGKFSPGTHIPIKTYDAFKERYPDVALLFAWNHGEEIMEKEKAFMEANGKWLVYVPEVKVL